MEDLISRQQALKECKGSIYACNHIEALPSINPIDGFVDYLIKERCQGCKCCDPKAEENKNVFCCEQGFAHWVMEMAERYKGDKHEMSI